MTPLGHEMLALPVHPRLARLLVAARHDGWHSRGCHRGRAAVGTGHPHQGFIQVPRYQPTRMPAANGLSDILDRLDLTGREPMRCGSLLRLRSRGVDTAAARLVAMLRDELLRRNRSRQSGRRFMEPRPFRDDRRCLQWLLLAYPDRVVKRRGVERTGVMVGGRGVRLGPESVVRDAELYLALDAREDRRAGPREAQVTMASTIKLEWLEGSFPVPCDAQRLTRYDESRRRVIARESALVSRPIASRGSVAGGRPERGRIRAGRGPLAAARPAWFEPRPAAHWLARLDFVTQALPELGWTRFDDEAMAQVFAAVCQGKTSLDDVEKADFVPFLQSRLAPALIRELDESAPRAITVPSGRKVRLDL